MYYTYMHVHVFVGTVEFVMDKDQNFYFMEMNTRLQVSMYSCTCNIHIVLSSSILSLRQYLLCFVTRFVDEPAAELPQ